jgi:hypothetical protein
MLTISSGHDPLYLTRAVATGQENYYLSGAPLAVAGGDGNRSPGRDGERQGF